MKSICCLIITSNLITMMVVGLPTNQNLDQDINLCGSDLIKFSNSICKNYNIGMTNVDSEMTEFLLRQCCSKKCSIKQIIINHCLQSSGVAVNTSISPLQEKSTENIPSLDVLFIER